MLSGTIAFERGEFDAAATRFGHAQGDARFADDAAFAGIRAMEAAGDDAAAAREWLKWEKQHATSPLLAEGIRLLGVCAGPDDVFLALRGTRTLSVRLAQHYRSGLEMARWLAGRPEVLQVLHPALESHPGHAIWKRDFTGASGLFAIVQKPVPEKAVIAFLNALTLYGMGASWGGFESLAIPFDVKGVELGHHGKECSFEAIVKKYALANDPALVLLGRIVNGADTDNSLWHQPESAGLQAIAEGFRHLGFENDMQQNEAEWIVYDALYAYCQEMVRRNKPEGAFK